MRPSRTKMRRLLAWRAARSGLQVALYEASGRLGEGAAAWAAAGMITPAAEAVDADAEIVAMWRRSLALWPQWLSELPHPVFYRDVGTLLFWIPAMPVRRIGSRLCYEPATRKRSWIESMRMVSVPWNQLSICAFLMRSICPGKRRSITASC
jgi:glycine/D-amino acid oxidase-like deaminating enzyme